MPSPANDPSPHTTTDAARLATYVSILRIYRAVILAGTTNHLLNRTDVDQLSHQVTYKQAWQLSQQAGPNSHPSRPLSPPYPVCILCMLAHHGPPCTTRQGPLPESRD